jgi:hypothetical protein
MKLRDHPLMSSLGMRNWPPAWLWNSGAEDTMPNGEVGLLKNVILCYVKELDWAKLEQEHALNQTRIKRGSDAAHSTSSAKDIQTFPICKSDEK